MTFTDVVILIILGSFISYLIYRMIKNREKGRCASCSYSKQSVKQKQLP